MDVIVEKLERNDRVKCDEAVRLLTKIVDNVLTRPKDVKLRTLKRNNVTINNKILSIDGGLDCLHSIGFRENGDELTLPIDVPLDRLRQVKENVLNVVLNRNSRPQISGVTNNHAHRRARPRVNDAEEIVKPITLPTLNHIYHSNAFLREIETLFHNTLIHNDTDLLKRAKRVVPLRRITESAASRLRDLQVTIKKRAMEKRTRTTEKKKKTTEANVDEEEVCLKDMELLELLDWFKNDFFTWIDSPECERCGSDTKFSHISQDRNLMLYTDRVEMHKCAKCDNLTPFPRYNDLNILLETRRGRCGEWANVFTLLCRCLGWDTRIVHCQTDHVWTEVYSDSRKRWLHCDPCENVCDNPLMYEIGWNKRLSYVIAYGLEELQDVTWRYTSNHKETAIRRTKCTEVDLTDAIVNLNKIRQTTILSLNVPRTLYLTRRCLNELVEFLTERKPTKDSELGRSSGSLDWRLSRNETNLKATIKTNNVFTFDDANSSIVVRYSPVTNIYERLLIVDNGTVENVGNGWESMVYECDGIFRKVEKDWKMVYLCRNETADEGRISWLFKIDGNHGNAINKRIRNVEIDFDYVTFESGRVDVDIEVDGCEDVKKLDRDTKTLKLSNLDDCNWIKIVARLVGGNGDVRWQHAQLFRQKIIEDPPYPFVIKFDFV